MQERLDEILGQAAGQISMCWESIEKAGVFKSEQALAIVKDT